MKNDSISHHSPSEVRPSGRGEVLQAEVILPSGELSSVVSNNQAQNLDSRLLSEVVENYLRYYALGDGHTARAKRYDLGYLLDFLAEGQLAQGINSSETTGPNRKRVLVSSWTMQATNDFIDHRLALGEAPATVGRRLATIKHFGRTLAERVHGFINPAREVKSPTLQPNRPHGLNSQEVSLLRQAASLQLQDKNNSFLAQRNCFLLELLLSTGLRADEVRLLTTGQISADHCWLRNVKTKGRKFRNVYLETDIRPLITKYLLQREAEFGQKFPGWNQLSNKEKSNFPVLVSWYRATISQPSSFGLGPKSIWRIIADFGKAAQRLADSPVANLHPHKLRHTFAHGLLDSSKDVRLVAQALGHSDVRTTMRYTERTDQEIAQAIEEKCLAEKTC